MMKTIRMVLLLAIAVLLTGTGSPSILAAPYDSYNYSYWEEAVPAPAPYLPSKVISGEDLDIGGLNSPQDMFVSEDRLIYIADTGNNRIVVLDADWKLIRTISEFERSGKRDGFNKPTGIFVKPDGTLYVADSDNKRVVMLTSEGEYIKQIDRPVSDVLPKDFAFNPLKVAVDRADRVYIVAKGVFEGIMQIDSSGAFIGYLGTNTVTANVTDYFWKMVSTKAQRAQMALFVPTEFTNMDMDAKDFVFTTNIDKNVNNPIKRLNPSGSDVLKRYGYFGVSGDLLFPLSGLQSGPSQFSDIKAGSDGTYSALDSLRGRIFTYDEEGNLLYIFGQIGSVRGTFKTPTALEKIRDQYLVLDAGHNRISVFSPTRFGGLVNRATQLHYEGREQEAAEEWRKVLALNANYDLAYIGLGKASLREHDYKEAMRNFELGMNRKYYAVAYSRYRKQMLQENLGAAFTAVALLGAAFAAWYAYRRFKSRRSISHEA
ncbi:NHL repeat-containing protein [Paenibacillus spongiae]|uniref:Gluconolactonase n=1 Tax=Paenibacillus spongiae TaxID=2909671 RepID=A0ABY5SDF0_9BACL|nr:NHL repeat-containing protein [Paenibacillus spongiae]UVI31982.1 gluconolactonase [Paenibacillus spongiae]